ncbi:hypothetical protein ANMWB30_23000 [Arthrobacter sp. MWB30]|nr:hypothetical protein ANMWB30_23000 [Arthrobacter sp. MWB30]
MAIKDSGPDGFKSASTEPPVAAHEPDGKIRETHPAFATASVLRRSGTPRTLFQSDLRHHETITLTIHEAERTRDLNHDWVHPTKNIIEIEMSLAQWGSLVSSMGLGSGVPVTLRWRAGEGNLPRLPYLPRIQKNLEEVHGAVDKLLGRARASLGDLVDAIEQKKGVKAIRDALRTHRFVLENAKDNAGFAVTSLVEAAEHVTTQARADIESHILATMQSTGHQPPIQLPSFEKHDAQRHIGGTALPPDGSDDEP